MLGRSLFITVQELPPPVKYTSLFYITCVFIYNVIGSYKDSKLYLHNYRQKQLDKHDSKEITSDWEAVKYGAKVNFWNRLFDSMIWPVTSLNNIIPIVVLKLNPP